MCLCSLHLHSNVYIYILYQMKMTLTHSDRFFSINDYSIMQERQYSDCHDEEFSHFKFPVSSHTNCETRSLSLITTPASAVQDGIYPLNEPWTSRCRNAIFYAYNDIYMNGRINSSIIAMEIQCSSGGVSSSSLLSNHSHVTFQT